MTAGINLNAYAAELPVADKAIGELRAGLEAWRSLPLLSPGTRNEISESLKAVLRRQDLQRTAQSALQALQTALENLIADGFPGTPVKALSAEALADIRADLAVLGDVAAELAGGELKASVIIGNEEPEAVRKGR